MDAYHLNSSQQLPDGNLLVSSRNTWSVYKISVKTGKILWTLGGKYGNFKMGRGARFEWQHDARMAGKTLTVSTMPTVLRRSRSPRPRVLDVNVSAKTVKLVKRYTHNPPLLAATQGSAQLLPNGNMFVGWGSEPDFSEYSPSGRQIFNGSFALGTTSYRAFRFPWRGHPHTPPAMATSNRARGGEYVWASWNGATNVAAWRVLGGQSPSGLRRLDNKVDSGFETQIRLDNRPRYVEVQALDRHGRVLGTSTLRSLP
jgi:hypothetical protein